MPLIDTGRLRLHVQELNPEGAETVVLLHGMFSNLAVYYFKIAPLLARRYHVVLYDMKGHGMSDKAASGYTLGEMTEDLFRLMDTLSLEKVFLTGYSFGGLVALNAAVTAPDRLEKLAVIEAPDPSEQETLTLVDQYSREFLIHYIENFTDTTRMQMGKRQLERNHRMYEFLFHETTIRSDMERSSAFFTDERLRHISRDTLLLYGEASNCLSAGTQLAKRLPAAALRCLPGDHNLPIQQPEAVGNALFAFFEGKTVADPTFSF